MDQPGVKTLNERDLQILQAIGENRTVKEIAGDLGLSPKTVEFHIDGTENPRSLASKLGLSGKGKTALVRFAAENGLLRKPDPPKPLKSAGKVMQSADDLAQALLAGASRAADGTADVLQLNALCNCSDALCRLAALRMKAEEHGSGAKWLN